MSIEDRVQQLFTRIILLENEVEELKDNKKEIYYQRFLEKHFQATHKVTKYGVTDITTETHHIEIKCWKNYKGCLGQLMAYNFSEDKQLIAALFGEYKDKEKVIELLHQKKIEVWDLVKSPNGVEIEKHKLQQRVIDVGSIDEFIRKHIEKNEGGKVMVMTVINDYISENNLKLKDRERGDLRRGFYAKLGIPSDTNQSRAVWDGYIYK